MTRFLHISGGIELILGAIALLRPDLIPVDFSELIPFLMLGIGIFSLIAGTFWDSKKKVEPKIPASDGNEYTNIKFDNSNNSGFINTGEININKRFELDETLIASLISQMDKSRSVLVLPYGSNPRTEMLAEKLEEMLVKSGFTISGHKMSAGFISSLKLNSPITVCPNGYSNNGLTIMGGQQLILIDANIQP